MSPPDYDHNVHQQLGALDAKVDRIIADQEQARSDRKQQYGKAEMMERRMDSVDRTLSQIGHRLDQVEPIAQDISKWRERFIGMRLLIVGVSAVCGGLVVAAGKWIAIKFGWV